MRVATAAGDRRGAERLAERLIAAGLDARPTDLDAPAGAALLVIDAQGLAKSALRAAIAAARAGDPPGLAIALATHARTPAAASLAAFVDGAIAVDDSPARIAAGLGDAQRLWRLMVEVGLRRETARALGLGWPAQKSRATPLRALFAGPPSAAFLAIERGLLRRGFALDAAIDWRGAIAALDAHAFDALLVDGREDRQSALIVAGHGQDDAWRPGPAVGALLEPERAGLGAALPRLIESHGPAMAHWALDGLAFEARLRRRERALVNALCLAPDARGGRAPAAMAEGFFRANLDRLGEWRRRSGAPACVAALLIAPALGAEPCPSAWALGVREAANLAVFMLGPEAGVCVVKEEAIAITLPGYALDAARGAIARLTRALDLRNFVTSAGAPLLISAGVSSLGAAEPGLAALGRAMTQARQPQPA